MAKKPVIIGMGEVLFDIFPTSRQMGGAPINFVYHASRLGAEGYAISAVGDDENGWEIKPELAKAGLKSIIETVPYPTGTVMVEIDNEGIPTYTITEGAAWDHIPLTAPMLELAARADAICFGTLAQRNARSRSTIREVLVAVPDDAYRVFDINFRQHYYSKDIIIESLRHSNIVKLNHEELATVKDIFHLQDMTDDQTYRWMLEYSSLKMVVMTAGASHSTIYTHNEVSTIDTPKVDVVDTVGAGDAFSGALISALLDGAALADAHRFAVEKAAFVVTREGAWPEYE